MYLYVSVERFHSTFLEMYRITKTDHPLKDLFDLVDLTVHKYNSSIHSVTKFTPIEIVCPSEKSSEIIIQVQTNLRLKQEKDLYFFNKTKVENEIPDTALAFVKTNED